MLHRAWRVLRLVLIAYSLVLLLMMFLEESLIFVPLNFPEDIWHPVGLPVEDANFQADDGTRLHGWYVPHPNARAVVLFSHGNAGNVTHRTDQLKQLHDRVGVSVLVYDYRGFGKSEGKPNEAGVLADARAARAWLARRAGVREAQIVQMGESLGGGIAVDLAAKEGARALVLEKTFTSLPDVAAHHYPWLPVRTFMKTRLDSLAKIKDFRGPLFQAHSKSDTIIPYRFGRQLFEAANEPKEFFQLRGDHNDTLPETYYDALAAFIEKLPSGRRYSVPSTQYPVPKYSALRPAAYLPFVLRFRFAFFSFCCASNRSRNSVACSPMPGF